ncbi:hypothetical protein [Aliamphritea hakodatensis]|uniref:hypothetical protein n=1 Tax=Aliamphritea hakodatensis TaxID=2895352 RepID=UPI0022FDA4DD|nr:hypothetical protein [Aliamphritea hakodatensis]
MDMSFITTDLIRAACQRLDYKFFEYGDYNLNIVGIRTADDKANTFNDFITVSFKVQGEWRLYVFDATTDPGVYYRQNPLNVLGTAILAAGQHPGAFKLGKHRGLYPALVQASPLPVHRDNDKDAELDTTGLVDEGWHGINMHHASARWVSKLVDKWSAGCQVLASKADLDFIVGLCRHSAALYGNRFTYTLLDEQDLKHA